MSFPISSPERAILPSADEALDAIRSGVIVVDAQRIIVRWNRAIAEMAGIAAEGAIGRDLWACLPSLGVTGARSVIIDAIENRATGACTCTIGGSDTDPALTLLSARPLGSDLVAIEIEPASPLIDAVVDRAITQRAESEALTQVARALAGAGTNLDHSLRLLAEQTRTLLDASGACITLLEPDVFRVAVAVGSLAPEGSTYSRHERTLSLRAITERRVVISNDYASALHGGALQERWAGIQQVVLAPMTVEDEVVGVLVAADSARGAFAAGDGMLLQRLADHGALAVRNGQLFQRAEQSAREARALGEIVQRINQSLEVDRVFALIARHAAELLQGRGARLGMLDADELVLAACVGAASKEEGERVKLDLTFEGHCVRTGRPAHASKLAEHADRWPWSAAHVHDARDNVVAAPLRVGDRTIGTISVFGNDMRDFDGHDESLLLTLANHAAVAIENARLYRASVRTMRHANILATSARSLALNVTPRAMYADIGRVARTSLRADGVALYIADATTGHVECAHADGAGTDAMSVTVPTFWESAGGAVVRSGVSEFRSDIHEFLDEAVMRALTAAGVQSVAVLPLHVEGRPRGLLALRFLAAQSFEAEQRQLLADFSTHAAVALRNALLFGDLERRAGRLAAVAQVQQAISAAVSLDEVYTEIYKAVASVVDAPCFALLGFAEESNTFVPAYLVSDGVPISVANVPRLRLGEGATSQAFRTGEPNIAARSTRGWTGRSHHVDNEREIAVVLSAPIVHGEVVLGVLQAQSYRHDAYNWDDVDLTMLIARQAGTAITNARAFAAERRQRQQAEAAADVARTALQARGVEQVAERLLEVVNAVVAASGSALAITDQSRSRLRIVAARGSAKPRLGVSVAIDGPLDAAGVARAASIGVSPDGGRAPDAIVPLASGDRVLGALIICQRDSDDREDGVEPFSAEEHAALTRLAAPIALAFDTLLLREDERLQEARQRMMATALETLEQPVFVYDRRGSIVYANGAATREFQYDAADVIGLDAQRTMVEPLALDQIKHIYSVLLRVGAWSGERLAKRRDGSEFPAWVMVSAIRDASAEFVGAVGIVRNLSEERRVAEQLRQSEKLAALGELVAGVAHEVNNPLTGISALAQLMQEDELVNDPRMQEHRESVRLIKKEADRAVAVIRDLLTFARKTGPRSVAIDMNDLIEQTLRLRNYGLRTAGVTVDLTLASNLWRVRGDDRQLQQVLLNLVVNAEHAMSGAQTRHLGLRTRNEFDRVVVEVSDSGSGMSLDVQQRIFEPFFTTKPEGKGTGLGLSVSYGIVQTHGGTLTVRSSTGAGATFRVSLPAERPERAEGS